MCSRLGNIVCTDNDDNDDNDDDDDDECVCVSSRDTECREDKEGAVR